MKPASFYICKSAFLCVLLFAAHLALPSLFAEGELPDGLIWKGVDYGAVADGATDCTAAIQAALDDAGKAGGGTVALPAGRFCVRGNLSVPRGVTLEGTYRAAITIENRDQKADGTILMAYAGRGSNDGSAFITLAGSNAVLKGISVIYPEWDMKDVPPVPYPPCVESHDAENVGVIDCCLLNPYEGIKFVRAPRHLVRNVTGYPVWRGLFVDECYDIGHIENVHYWPFGVAYNPKNPYCEWINLHGVAFELARTDWHYMSNLFCFGYGVGYKFSDCGHGGTNGNFLGIGADSCRRAILVEAAQTPGLLITNGEFVGRWTSSDSVCVEIADEAAMVGKVSLTNCSFWGPIASCIKMSAPNGQLTVNASHFCNWDISRAGEPAIRLEKGKSIISASTFLDDGTCVSVGENVRNVILTANQGRAGFIWKPDSAKAESRTAAVGNEDVFAPVQGEELDSYMFKVGGGNESYFLKDIHGVEKTPEGAFCWTQGSAQITLPVNPEKEADIELELSVPARAVAKGKGKTGIFLNGELLLPLEASERHVVKFRIPLQKDGTAKLELNAKKWVPDPHGDTRQLGVQIFGIKVKSADYSGGEKYYDADSQTWVEVN